MVPLSGHVGGNATCESKAICTRCSNEYGGLSSHNWIDATCTNPKMCSICETTDGVAKGHAFKNGECTNCHEIDPDYVFATITASKNEVTLIGSPETIYITVIGFYTVSYDIKNDTIVDCEWGDWDGDTIPLTFTPKSTGQTIVELYLKGLEVSLLLS